MMRWHRYLVSKFTVRSFHTVICLVRVEMLYQTFDSPSVTDSWKQWICCRCFGTVSTKPPSPGTYRTIKVRSRFKSDSSDSESELAERTRQAIVRRAVLFDRPSVLN